MFPGGDILVFDPVQDIFGEDGDEEEDDDEADYLGIFVVAPILGSGGRGMGGGW